MPRRSRQQGGLEEPVLLPVPQLPSVHLKLASRPLQKVNAAALQPLPGLPRLTACQVFGPCLDARTARTRSSGRAWTHAPRRVLRYCLTYTYLLTGPLIPGTLNTSPAQRMLTVLNDSLRDRIVVGGTAVHIGMYVPPPSQVGPQSSPYTRYAGGSTPQSSYVPSPASEAVRRWQTPSSAVVLDSSYTGGQRSLSIGSLHGQFGMQGLSVGQRGRSPPLDRNGLGTGATVVD